MNSLPLYRRVSRIGDSIAVNVYSDNENVFERLGLLYDDRFSPDEPCLSMALYIVTCLDGGIELPVVETPVFHGDMLLVIDEGGMRYSDYAAGRFPCFRSFPAGLCSIVRGFLTTIRISLRSMSCGR